MKIFYSCATAKLIENKESYLHAIKTIKEEGHTLTRDWVGKAVAYAEKGIAGRERHEIYSEVILAISQADLVIIDTTVRSMGLGHQVTYSLHNEKPTLILERGLKHDVKNLFVAGSKSPYLSLEQYNSHTNLSKIIKKFLTDNSVKSKIRFQLVMNKTQFDYVSWASYKYSKNKSEIIKNAINKAAEDDLNYFSET